MFNAEWQGRGIKLNLETNKTVEIVNSFQLN